VGEEGLIEKGYYGFAKGELRGVGMGWFSAELVESCRGHGSQEKSHGEEVFTRLKQGGGGFWCCVWGWVRW
jgi:hypothetical protein